MSRHMNHLNRKGIHAREIARPCRIFVDMDGTLAEYKEAADLSDLYVEGYFANLAPNERVCEAVRQLVKASKQTDSGVEVYILSAVLMDSPYALEEKGRWLDRIFGVGFIDDDHRLFVPCGEPKARFVEGGLSERDVLLDDYSKNLFEWENAGGSALKLLNGINATKGTWKKERISYLRTASDLAGAMVGFAQGRMHPFDKQLAHVA